MNFPSKTAKEVESPTLRHTVFASRKARENPHKIRILGEAVRVCRDATLTTRLRAY